MSREQRCPIIVHNQWREGLPGCKSLKALMTSASGMEWDPTICSGSEFSGSWNYSYFKLQVIWWEVYCCEPATRDRAQASFVSCPRPFLRVCTPAMGNAFDKTSVVTVERLLLNCQRTSFPPDAEVKLTPSSPAASQQMHLKMVRSIFKRKKYLIFPNLMQRGKNLVFFCLFVYFCF